jgi:hypothetical protein
VPDRISWSPDSGAGAGAGAGVGGVCGRATHARWEAKVTLRTTVQGPQIF